MQDVSSNESSPAVVIYYGSGFILVHSTRIQSNRLQTLLGIIRLRENNLLCREDGVWIVGTNEVVQGIRCSPWRIHRIRIHVAESQISE